MKRFQQVLLNLQSNALKFTKKGDFIKMKIVYVERAGSKNNQISKVRTDSFFN